MTISQPTTDGLAWYTNNEGVTCAIALLAARRVAVRRAFSRKLYDGYVGEIDIDEIAEVNFTGEDASQAEVRFKDGSVKIYNGAEHPEVFAMLNHWTAPTA